MAFKISFSNTQAIYHKSITNTVRPVQWINVHVSRVVQICVKICVSIFVH